MFILYIICIVVLLLILLSTLFLIIDSQKFTVPGPTPLPIVGNGHKFLVNSSEMPDLITNFIKKYGEITGVYIMYQRFVLITSPKYIEAVISTSEHNTKGDSYKFLHAWLGQGLLTATGNKWRTHRKFLTPAFHFNILKSFLPIFLKNDDIFVNKLSKVANGESVNIFPIMALLALDNITESAMGISANAQSDSESEYVRAVNELSVIVFKRMFNMFMNIDFFFNLSALKKRQDEALAILHEHTESVIRDRTKLLSETNTTLESYNATDDLGLKKKTAFLDLLLLSSVDGKKLDNISIREEVDTFMFEGHDTTTSGLSFAVYCISQHQSVQDKLFKEQEHIFGNDLLRHPTHTDLSDMKYLEAVIKESLRLYPSVPLISRITTEDSVVGDYFLPKNTNILIGIMHMQRNENIYEDPMSFKPERFENMNTDQKSAYNFVAFSAGPRNCIGQKFAMMEMKVVLSSVIRRFRLLPSDIKPKLCMDLILRSTNGVHVKILPRK